MKSQCANTPPARTCRWSACAARGVQSLCCLSQCLAETLGPQKNVHSLGASFYSHWITRAMKTAHLRMLGLDSWWFFFPISDRSQDWIIPMKLLRGMVHNLMAIQTLSKAWERDQFQRTGLWGSRSLDTPSQARSKILIASWDGTWKHLKVIMKLDAQMMERGWTLNPSCQFTSSAFPDPLDPRYGLPIYVPPSAQSLMGAVKVAWSWRVGDGWDGWVSLLC